MTALLLHLEPLPRPLLWTALAHALLAALCLVALTWPAAPLMGMHPALKPLKFAVSIAVFLGTLGVLLPSVTLSPGARSAFAWMFAVTMVLEMAPILVQAARGTLSHFNEAGGVDTALWRLMVGAIVVASAGMFGLAMVASFRPLTWASGEPMEPLVVFGWRAGLWLLCLSPVSGFAMGGRLQHSVGGPDGGPGLPFLNWSLTHGDLRVSHFLALHALQLFPLLAWGLVQLALPGWMRWAALGSAVAATSALCVGTFVQALAGRPFLPGGG